jgi:hypothetical protein
MQERHAAINVRFDATESETARLAAERLSLEDDRRELERAVLVAKDEQHKADVAQALARGCRCPEGRAMKGAGSSRA